ncbi:hypothetical protein A5647_24825 [Mycobacterium sp. 1100029.7]|nr:hypothetical protein A5647_24825 [Mycobacterium sp. 1100029.7]
MDGTPFGRYRLIEMLGRGGMGEVWRAYDTETKRTVAIKVLPAHLADDNEFARRFRREAEAAAQLNSPHVIPIHHYGEIDSRLYVDMRLIDGRDLGTCLTEGPLEPARAVRIIDQVAKALHAAHKVGLIHRDIKPSNILLDDDDFAYLIDFGIARAADDTRMTKSGNTIGTFQYIAPERLDSQFEEDARADIYSLACVFYEALTGQPPFAGRTTAQLMFAHVNTPPPRPSTTQPDVPPQVDKVIATGMAKDPNQRYANTIELADAARDAITVPIGRPKPTPIQPPTQEAPTSPAPVRVAKPSSRYAQPLLPLVGSWAKVVAVGDDHYGQIGRIKAICDDDDADGLDVIVEFRGDPSSYAFRRDELVAASAPANAAASGDQFPTALPGSKRPDMSVPGLILFLVVLIALAVLLVVAIAMLRP